MSLSLETPEESPSEAPRRVITGQNAFTVALIVFGAAFAVMALDMDLRNDRGQPAPGMVPFFAGAGLSVSSLYLLVRQLQGNSAVKAAAGSTGEPLQARDRRTAIVAAAMIALFIVLLPIIGIWESTILYCLASAFFLNQTGRVKAAVGTVLVPLAILAIFDILFALDFPEGLLFS